MPEADRSRSVLGWVDSLFPGSSDEGQRRSSSISVRTTCHLSPSGHFCSGLDGLASTVVVLSARIFARSWPFGTQCSQRRWLASPGACSIGASAESSPWSVSAPGRLRDLSLLLLRRDSSSHGQPLSWGLSLVPFVTSLRRVSLHQYAASPILILHYLVKFLLRVDDALDLFAEHAVGTNLGPMKFNLRLEFSSRRWNHWLAVQWLLRDKQSHCS